MTHSSGTEVLVGGAVERLPRRVVCDAVTHVLHGEQRDAAVAVTFLGPRRMRQMNAAYKHHDWPTDVLSFALPLPDGSLTGDIYVCPYVAAREARSRGLRVRDELIRLVIHGTLHVLGYEHPETAGRTESPMWRRQEQYVRALT